MSASVRKVINGRVYDTDTAEFVAVIEDNNGHYSDIDEEWTGLFKSPRGQWFLAGEGASNSRWRKPVGGGYTGGNGVKLLDADEARKLLEEADGDIEAHFEIAEG